MAGIEDVAGFHGHHELRVRFENFELKYLKPLLIRERQVILRGRSIVSVYQKLIEHDATEYLRRTGSFTVGNSSSTSLTNKCVHSTYPLI